LDPLVPRFIIAGLGFIAGGVAIAVIREGVGEQAVLIGSVVAVLGFCLVISGIQRHRKGPPN